MMSNTVRVYTRQFQGMTPQELCCEAFVLRGMQNFSLSGLPDSILKDSKDKIRALIHSYVPWDPLQRLIVNLLPPEFSKCGAHLELAIFISSIVALSEEFNSSEVLQKNLATLRFYGGLSLEGKILETQESALLLEGDEFGIGPPHFETLAELIEALKTKEISNLKPNRASNAIPSSPSKPIPKVQARYHERLALLVGAILEEPILLVGPPGVGKTYLGHWARFLLPSPRDKQELKHIWSLAPEALNENEAPFLNPHARAQLAEFMGYRRQNRTYPGYFSLCHQGTLLVDEFPELSRDIREVMRNVLDTRAIRTLQGRSFCTWPARFWFIATANPCACGEALPQNLGRCRCTRGQLQQYLQRFSGPLLDRIGIQIVIEKSSSDSSECSLAPSLVKLLDSSAKDLQEYVALQRSLIPQDQQAQCRKELKKLKIKNVLENMNFDEVQQHNLVTRWTRSFLSKENFR